MEGCSCPMLVRKMRVVYIQDNASNILYGPMPESKVNDTLAFYEIFDYEVIPNDELPTMESLLDAIIQL